MSAELLFCLTSLLFLAWVILLKRQIVGLKQQISRLQEDLAEARSNRTAQVDVSRPPEVWETHPER